MTGTLIGNARCSTDEQNLTSQRKDLAKLGDHSPILSFSTASWA
jgi:hypothetical protein